MGRNPKTGHEVPIAPRRVLVFRPSHVLKADDQRRNAGPRDRRRMSLRPSRSDRSRRAVKSPEAFRTISEVPTSSTCRSMCCASGKRVSRRSGRSSAPAAGASTGPKMWICCAASKSLLYFEGYTIKGVQKVLRDRGLRYVAEIGRNVAGTENAGGAWRGAETVLRRD